MAESRARRFLNAFTKVEAAFDAKDERLHKERYVSFSEMLERSTLVSEKQKVRFRSLAKLRNAIVHNAYDGDYRPIADPRESEVAWIEQQVELLEKPPIAYEVLNCAKPDVLDETADIARFFRLASPPQNYSQAPVRTVDGRYELITTNAVARWVASSYSQEAAGALVDMASVRDVLQFSESEDMLIVKPRRLKAVDAIQVFGGLNGTVPQAILLTQNGNDSERPLGIIVRSDIVPLLHALGV